MQADYLFDRLLIQPPLRLTTLAQTSLHRIIADMRDEMVAPMEWAGEGFGHASWSPITTGFPYAAGQSVRTIAGLSLGGYSPIKPAWHHARLRRD